MARRKQPIMTAGQATAFGRYSVTNAATAETALGCGCKAYRDIFTYNRWKAQGMQVQRGQKSVKLPTLHNVEQSDSETGETTQYKVFGTSNVFCRHQVAAAGNTPQGTVHPPTDLVPTTPAPTDDVMSAWTEV